MKISKRKISKLILPLLICTSMVTPVMVTPAMAGGMKANSLQLAANQKVQKQAVEVVFVLDTTGSMGGLIEGAKAKIWHIANEIQNAQTNVEVRMGLIAYRDRGDTYVTKHFPITNDIHSIYADLIEFKAGGGGDHPESVNQALYEAVQQQNWSDAHDTLRIVFLVGDAPPKMNYQDDVKYMQTVKLAKQKDIIINTILAGSDHNTKRVWQEIAQNANGAFSQIAQDGNVTVVSTPYDDEIQQLSIELNTTIIVYGSQKEKAQVGRVMESMAAAKPAASSDMAAFNAKRDIKSRIFAGKGDLLQELEMKTETLGTLDNEKLPTIMQNMDADQRAGYVAEMQQKRSEIQAKIDDLSKQRGAFKAEKIAELSDEDKDSFDANLVKIIRKQAATKNIKY